MIKRICKKLGLSGKQLVLLLAAVPFNFLVYYSARALAAGFDHHDLSLKLDAQISVVSWTILIYWGCYIFWAVNYYLSARYDKGSGYRFLASHYIGEAICFFVFVVFPTTMTRGEIVGSSVFDTMLSMTYQLDQPNNLFPSIHCYASWLCYIGVRNNQHISKWYRVFSFFFAVAVFVSTLTVKQHVLVDIPAGILVAEMAYYLAGVFEKGKKL